MNIRIALAFTCAFAACGHALADDEAANRAVVRSSAHGAVYARSVPAETYGQKGKTKVYSVGKDADTLIAEYGWYANDIHLGGAGDRTLIRFGPWQRGREPQEKHLALGIYRDGATLREYSTLEMQRRGSGLSQSVSHYTVFRKTLGFRWLKGNAHVFEILGVDGKLFRFDLDTGALEIIAVDPDSAAGRTASPR